MFYEKKRSLNKNYLMLTPLLTENFSYPLHLHDNYEFIFVEDGLMRVEINGAEFDVSSGKGAFILPNQPHKFDTPVYSKCWLVIFSSDHIPELRRRASSNRPLYPIVEADGEAIRRELDLAQNDPLLLRSVLYRLASVYAQGESAPQIAIADGALVSRVVEYIDTHFAEPMTLEDISKELGYSYRYMSGVVNRFFKLPLPQVVNRYRVNLACEMLVSSDTEITQIALECGFGSMRSFNRSFKNVMGITPRDYRNKNR